MISPYPHFTIFSSHGIPISTFHHFSVTPFHHFIILWFLILCLCWGSAVVIRDDYSICHIDENILISPCRNIQKSKWTSHVPWYPSWVACQILVDEFLEQLSLPYSHFMNLGVRVSRQSQRHCAAAAQWVCNDIIQWDSPSAKIIEFCCRKLDILTDIFISDITAIFSLIPICW